MMTSGENNLRKPPWLRVRVPHGAGFIRMKDIVHGGQLHTVCEEAFCPNMGRCWEKGRATIMILGDKCTRACRFCNVRAEMTGEFDAKEPERVAEAVGKMALKDVVITSVTRDDLKDGGASIWAETIRRIHDAVPGIMVEVLIPDFGGSLASLEIVLAVKPDVLGHNLETVPSLYGRVRPQADYQRSLELLERAHDRGAVVKTGIMLGIGETEKEVLELMKDAIDSGCEIFYIGQYLQPTKKHLPVSRYVTPEEFESYKCRGLEMGFKVVVSAPLVRSSYHSEEQADYLKKRIKHK
ncbi:MAG: lipoyl synthase [Kiritimatiellae bacterium]|nr:lipoyl synthase [Kiritimatiellia bacterium]MDD5520617.1 lipoyl synthase [Kiritimatiellia bacterium]